MSVQRTEEINQIMSRIVEVRYLDIIEEQNLAKQLMQWAEQNSDIYAQAYAYTYLGDSLIAQDQIESAGVYLKEAETLLEAYKDADEVLVRMYSLLGIYCEWKTDEQSAVQYYLEALAVAKRRKDIMSECIVLNNLAQKFEMHNCFDTALEYLQEAYELQKEVKELPVRPLILSNMAMLYVKMEQLDKAWDCYLECEEGIEDSNVRETFLRRNRCCYYAACGEREKARYWAELVLDNSGQNTAEKFELFDNYNLLCEAMFRIEDEIYIKQFLDRMEETCMGSLEQLGILRDKKFKFSILFGTEEEKISAYCRFYMDTKELKKNTNLAIVESMKDKIYLQDLIQQNKELELEQGELERQANVDELTRIHNRRYLEWMIRESVRNGIGKCYGVIMIDIDFFKEYNDSYGHLEGDQVLRTVAQILKSNQKEGIRACRYGGDEFICLCVEKSDKDIERYIKAIQEELNEKIIHHNKSLCSDRVTLSIGYVNRTLTDKNGVYYLMQLADKALYESKLAGRNTYRRK